MQNMQKSPAARLLHILHTELLNPEDDLGKRRRGTELMPDVSGCWIAPLSPSSSFASPSKLSSAHRRLSFGLL
jgi:hypothetical protein